MLNEQKHRCDPIQVHSSSLKLIRHQNNNISCIFGILNFWLTCRRMIYLKKRAHSWPDNLKTNMQTLHIPPHETQNHIRTEKSATSVAQTKLRYRRGNVN